MNLINTKIKFITITNIIKSCFIKYLKKVYIKKQY